MDKRAVSIGVVVAMVAWGIGRLIASTRHALAQHIDVEAGMVIVGSLYQLASTFHWLLGGMAVGYLCSAKPIKNGAITGAIYGALFCLLGLILLKMDGDIRTFGPAHFFRVITSIAQYVFLFVLASCFGFALKAWRAPFSMARQLAPCKPLRPFCAPS